MDKHSQSAKIYQPVDAFIIISVVSALMENPTIYVITNYQVNHNSPGLRNEPIDSRFLVSNRNYVFYLIDEAIPAPLKDKQILFEWKIDPLLHQRGKEYFAEWSFLLAEAKHSFASYPMFMISSRFYEKNIWLKTDLNIEWDKLFSYLSQYGWGYLPSYNRPLGWFDLELAKFRKQNSTYNFLPFNESSFQLINEVYNVKIPDDYSSMSDLQCNYIGFYSREHLLDYVNFYRRLIDKLFDESYLPREEIGRYVKSTNSEYYPNEKPFTFLLEWMSHLFFYQNNRKFFALHYDAYYEINETEKKIRKLGKHSADSRADLVWYLQWRFHPLYKKLSIDKGKELLRKMVFNLYGLLPNSCRKYCRRIIKGR